MILTADDWVSAGQSQQMITSCHPLLLHGMYDMGQNPSAGFVYSVPHSLIEKLHVYQ